METEMWYADGDKTARFSLRRYPKKAEDDTDSFRVIELKDTTGSTLKVYLDEADLHRFRTAIGKVLVD